MAEVQETAKKVLIIEDHVDVADIEMLLCDMEGYQVQLARDGVSGWAAIQEFQPDLVLLDLMLPGELTGNDVLKKIRQDIPEAPPRVLVVSALINANTTPNLLQPGQVETMSKPFMINELADRVRRMLQPA